MHARTIEDIDWCGEEVYFNGKKRRNKYARNSTNKRRRMDDSMER